ncbi:hypothetical protein BCR34DRAFT_224792 [Clohesyomyces aquaticus]|uniref:Uncharacterized protein n=1 Tax=Clohesyomyces aquaticus TaxID=1231657 RepID=A0A1Y1ZWU7_9PLEO|nr:hypothetical protein BCR34DRAFT_224792 [Clohesyomyces aquaticus]
MSSEPKDSKYEARLNLEHPVNSASKIETSSSTPKFAIFLVALSLTCVITVTIIIFLSNDRSFDHWPPAIQPAVLFALCTGIFNAAQAYILTAGVTVVWWRSTLHEGTKLKDLHYVWNKGEWKSWHGFKAAVASSWHVRWVMGVSCIVAIASIADGPLLQRATKTILARKEDSYTDITPIPWTIKDGWTGVVDRASPASLFATADLDQVLQDWYLNRTIVATNACNDTCKGTLTGAGLATNCTSSFSFLDLTASENANSTLFSLEFSRASNLSGVPILDMRLQYAVAVDSSCNATLALVMCTIQTALVEYRIIQIQDSIALDRGSSVFPFVEELKPSIGDSSTAQDRLPAGPLRGIEYFAYYYLQANGTVTHDADGTYGFEPGYGNLAKQYRDLDPAHFSNEGACTFQWTNATDDVLWGMHDVMFRIAQVVEDGSGSSGPWTREFSALTYQSHFGIFWAAFCFMLLSWFASLSLLWGFWSLEREVSLSPLETARALADGIKHVEGTTADVEIEKIMEEMGEAIVTRVHRRIKGGNVDDSLATGVTKEQTARAGSSTTDSIRAVPTSGSLRETPR